MNGPRRAAAALAAACAVAIGASPALASSAFPPDFFGVYTEDTMVAEPTAREVTLRQQSATGLGVVRVPFDWATMQPDPDRYELAAHDEYVLAAARAGLRVLPFLVQVPGWATSEPSDSEARGIWPPAYPGFITGFARTVAARYGPGGSLWREHPDAPYLPIRSWQVWNEPNHPAFWASGPDPAAYVRLVEAAAGEIRAIDPSAEIVAAGLPESERAVPMRTFLSEMYEAGAGAVLDTVAVHPYASEPEHVLDLIADARDVVARHGDDAAVWATEFGWASGGPPSWVVTDETGQADRVRRAVELLARERRRLRLRGMVLYSWRDSEGSGWQAHAGLRRIDASPKPSWFALRDAIAGLLAESPAGTALRAARPPGASGVTAATGEGWSVRILARNPLRASRRGTVPLRVRCGRRAVWYCTGSVWIEAPARGRRAPVQLATRAFRARTGRTDRVALRLTRRARRLLRTRRGLRVTVRAGGVDLHGREAEAALRARLLRGALR